MDVFQVEGNFRQLIEFTNDRMGDEAFDEKLLTERLSKLNSSQQSIESLSQWSISHRKKAKQVVETWERFFYFSQQEQQVSFLYLANDILQNSRYKGSEFVNEFWKVLPKVLKGIYNNGDENCRKVASRLVDIWEERKVFGSRGPNLKNEMLGKNPPPVNNGMNSYPIKVVKRDANSLRIKLAVGGMPEKILTGFQLVHDEIVNEEAALDKCRNAVYCVREIGKDVNVFSQGNLQGSDVLDNIEEQENMIQQCLSQLENSEAIRVALVSQLREALQEQESELELIRSELLIARSQIEQAANMRQRLTAAAVAAKLTASTSSAQMLTSILSSLAAEEAASMNSSFKRPKLEKPMPFSDVINPEGAGANSSPFTTTQQAMTNVLHFQSTSMPPTYQLNPLQAPFLPPPPPPPPSLAPPANSAVSQLVRSNMMALPYSFGASNLVPLSLSSHATVGLAKPDLPPQQAQLQLLSNLRPPQQQQPANDGYYIPLGVGLYGHNH